MKTLEELRDYVRREVAVCDKDAKQYRRSEETVSADFFDGAAFAFRNMEHTINKMIEEQAQ